MIFLEIIDKIELEHVELLRYLKDKDDPIKKGWIIDIFMANKREYCIVKNEKLGKVIVSEIGATMVGSIIQTYNEGEVVAKGEEKGYFKFGGSSVMILFQKDRVKFDEDLISNTKAGYETYVRMGEGIGE